MYVFSYFRVEPGTKPQAEPKFVVFHGMLMNIFTIFCFNCKAVNPTAEIKCNGTMATVTQICKTCKPGKQFQWRSQPLVLGKHPAGNIMMSFGILMSGINISQAMLMFRHMNLFAISLRTYFVHQSKFLFPSILNHWESEQSNMIAQLKGNKDSSCIWSGDGRFDSPSMVSIPCSAIAYQNWCILNSFR